MQHHKWPILIVCAAVACSTASDRFSAQESAYRSPLSERYPPGSRWTEPRDAFSSFANWTLTEPAPDPFAALALARAGSQHGNVVRCRYGEVPRLTRGSSLGAMGIFTDYVFLDGEDRVLVAFRCFID